MSLAGCDSLLLPTATTVDEERERGKRANDERGGREASERVVERRWLTKWRRRVNYHTSSQVQDRVCTECKQEGWGGWEGRAGAGGKGVS